MAFGIASGVSPERGIFTAIVAGFLISLLGGSKLQIGGPTGAFVVLVYDIVQRSGYEGLSLATLLAGLLLIAFALLKIGNWIQYVPYPLIIGFTAGIGCVVFSAQIKDFFGLQMGPPPADFLEKWRAYGTAFPTFNPAAAALGVATLLLIVALRRYAPKAPWGAVAIAAATAAAWAFALPVDTVATKFGSLPRHLPAPSLPLFTVPWSQLRQLCLDAAAIACLGGIESLLSCVIADRMAGTRHAPNTELFGQGVANIASILFGGIPATGAIARTAANVKSGAATPVSGMVHALFLLTAIALFAPIASQIPLAALSAVLIVIAWNMSEFSHFFKLFKARPGEMAILTASFFLTVLVDITAAIGAGMVIAAFHFMKRMSESTAAAASPVPAQVELVEIEGPLFFGSAHLLQASRFSSVPTQACIIGLGQVPLIDATGVQALVDYHQQCVERKTPLFLAGVTPRIRRDLERFGVDRLIGRENLFPRLADAIQAIEQQGNRDKERDERQQGQVVDPLSTR
jgi:SulP family sulfate permease